MKIVQSFLILLVVVSCNFSQEIVTIESANKAFENLNLDEAKKHFSTIYYNINCSIEDKMIAGRKLAYIYWHFYKDLSKAESLLLPILKFDDLQVDILTDLAEYNLQNKSFTKAINYVQKAINLESNQIDELQRLKSEIILEEAIYLIENKKSFDRNLINKTFTNLNNVKFENSAEKNYLLLGFALILKDGAQIYDAFQNYNYIPSNDEKLKEILSRINKITQREIDYVIKEFAEARFYKYAALISKIFSSLNNHSPEIKKILTYHNLLLDIEHITYTYFNNIAINSRKTKTDLDDEMFILFENFWNKMNWGNGKFSIQNFLNKSYQEFGTVYLYDKIDGITALLGGHTVYDCNKSIKQYNNKMNLHYMVLDFMFGNIYRGWFLNQFLVGGWSPYGSVVQVRGYGENEPFQIWEKISDEKLFSEWQKETELLSSKDDSLAKVNPLFFLPGLCNRVQIKVYKDIMHSLEIKSKTNFVSKMQNEIINQGVFAHEGRHNIEMKLGNYNNAMENEYYAKLSQVYFSNYPFLGMIYGILDPITNTDTDHGNANKLILQNLINWIEENKNIIKGFDIKRPTICQLDLLTNKQLKEAIKSMDRLSE